MLQEFTKKPRSLKEAVSMKYAQCFRLYKVASEALEELKTEEEKSLVYENISIDCNWEGGAIRS